MYKRWSKEGYPRSYVDSFATPNGEAVAEVAATLRKNGERVKRVVIQPDTGGTSVYTTTDGTLKFNGKTEMPVTITKGVNWEDNNKRPIDYPEYASTFYDFKGPDGKQRRRAQMLAKELDVPLETDRSRIPAPRRLRGK